MCDQLNPMKASNAREIRRAIVVLQPLWQQIAGRGKPRRQRA
jgi:hypothetical protein